MVSRDDVDRWRDGFARVAPCEPFVNGDFQAMADMLAEAMDKLTTLAAQMDVGGPCPWCSEWPNGPHAEDCALVVLLREWRGEADDAE
jgi:hypothetical protein